MLHKLGACFILDTMCVILNDSIYINLCNAAIYASCRAGNSNKFNVVEFPVMPSFMSILIRVLYNFHEQLQGRLRFGECIYGI